MSESERFDGVDFFGKVIDHLERLLVRDGFEFILSTALIKNTKNEIQIDGNKVERFSTHIKEHDGFTTGKVADEIFIKIKSTGIKSGIFIEAEETKGFELCEYVTTGKVMARVVRGYNIKNDSFWWQIDLVIYTPNKILTIN
jgi:hypothetical protein